MGSLVWVAVRRRLRELRRKGRILSSKQATAGVQPGGGARERSTFWPVVLCYGGMVAIAIAVNLPPIYLTTFSQTFGGAAGLSTEQLGWIGTLLFAGLVAGLLVAGPLADRLGARVFVLLASGLIAGGLGLMSAAPSYPMLLFAATFLGVGAGVMDMILSPIVAALRPDRRTSAMNWLHSFYSIGAVLTTLGGSIAIGLAPKLWFFGWRYVCLAGIVVPLAVFVGFTRAMVPPLVAEHKERTSAWVLLGNVSFWAAMLAMTLAGASELGMAQWLPAYAEEGLKYPKSTAALALTGFSLAMAAGRLTGGMISRHIRPIRMLVASCAVTAVLYVAGAYCPWPPIALAACVMMGLSVSALWPTTLGVTADRFPHGGATMFALLAAFGNMGGTINLAIGSIGQHRGLHAAIACVAICPLMMIGILLWLGRHARVTAEQR
jgi:fucose permease